MSHDDGELLHRELLDAPDRDHCPGLRPVLARREHDDPRYLAALDQRALEHITLRRRGVSHGEWVELAAQEAAPAGVPQGPALDERWHMARPIVLRGALDLTPAQLAEMSARVELADQLAQPQGLARFLAQREEALAPDFEVRGALRPADRERDVARVGLALKSSAAVSAGPHVEDLWVKASRLSTYEADRSLRMRVSFGDEPADDASRDLGRQRAVGRLARALLPECGLLEQHVELMQRLSTWVGGELFLTQQIAYWNAPEGGALFHHDAFDEELEGGQRGVLYAQLAGRSAWLALSIEDLTRRVIEIVEYMQQGELEWVRAQLFPRAGSFERIERMARRFVRLRRELGRPGCGALGPLVGRGPEFSELLADAGHAFVLRPGDLALLPNHGLERTCMHSVFCPDDRPTYGLSCALREAHPEPAQPARARRHGPARERRSTHRGRGGRRRGSGRR